MVVEEVEAMVRDVGEEGLGRLVLLPLMIIMFLEL